MLVKIMLYCTLVSMDSCKLNKYYVIRLMEGPGGQATGPGGARAGHTLANRATRGARPGVGAAVLRHTAGAHIR